MMWNDIKAMNVMTRVMLGALALVLLFGVFRWSSLQPMFDLRVVRIQGAHHQPLRYVDAATVRSTALPRLRGNFFTADLHAVRAAFETVPWVYRASVRREWPNKLIVSIEEHVALGTWGEQEGRLLSAEGILFTANLDEAEQDGSLLTLDGPDDSAQEVAARLADIKVWLAPIHLTPRALILSKRYAWTARLDNGITLKLGREHSRDALKARVDRFVNIYPQLAARLPDRIESVDMRYPNGLALRARGLGAPPSKPVATPEVSDEADAT
jgi:cell division protein FtsQ